MTAESIFNHIIPHGDSEGIKAYLSLPEKPGPALILLHEVYGVNDSLKATADFYASQGFTVLCPNLYWRLDPNASFRPQYAGEEKTEDLSLQRDKAYKLMETMDYTKANDDIQTVIDHLRTHDFCTGNVGMIGFCMGGRIAFRAMAKTDCDAGVAFYATQFKDDLPLAQDIKRPFMFIVPLLDPYVSYDEKIALADLAGTIHYHRPEKDFSAFEYQLQNNYHIATHLFLLQNHAFARPQGLHYDETAAHYAHGEVIEYLKKGLSKPKRRLRPKVFPHLHP